MDVLLTRALSQPCMSQEPVACLVRLESTLCRRTSACTWAQKIVLPIWVHCSTLVKVMWPSRNIISKFGKIL